jgi:transcription elongation GreA/GreB family factor
MQKKEQLLKFCWGYVDTRTERLKKSAAALQESLDSETKSSAGDKHETGRAMVQLEQEKLAQQLVELDRLQEVLQKINVETAQGKIRLGSWVKTGTAQYFLAISCGAAPWEGQTVYCISAGSPIAQLLMGKEAGQTFDFNGNTHTILEVM